MKIRNNREPQPTHRPSGTWAHHESLLGAFILCPFFEVNQNSNAPKELLHAACNMYEIQEINSVLTGYGDDYL